LELFFEESLQVDPTDRRGGSVEASAHLDLFAYLLHQLRRNVESFRLAVNQQRDLKLRVQAIAVGATTVGPATGAFALDKRSGQHFAQSTEATDEFAAQFQVGFAGAIAYDTSISVRITESETPKKTGNLENGIYF
jgi:hypothetical protein